MAAVRPFRAVRPAPGLAPAIAAPPYDVVISAEARALAESSPRSFLHIDRGEINLPPGTDPHHPDAYAMAREVFDRMRAGGDFVMEETPAFYLYRLTRNGKAQTGLAALVSAAEYESGVIKRHELTRADKEEDRVRHVDALDAHTGPVLLTCRDSGPCAALMASLQARLAPLYDFTADDGVGHTVWRVDVEEDIAALGALFQGIPALYIADGHHRSASAVRVAAQRAAANPRHSGTEEYNFFLAVIFPHSQLEIMDYNRLVADLNGMTDREFLAALERDFSVVPVSGREEARPKAPAQFGLYLPGRWFSLALRRPPAGDCVERLDVSVLQDRVLTPLLGIGDVRTDGRIDFVGGIRGLAELERRVDSGGMAAAFAMYPTSIDQLMEVADGGRIMPPKSTWFEPKLRSGLLIHLLED